MDVLRCADATAFLAATVAYRSAEPLRTNVQASVAATVAAGSTRFDECFWWLVLDGGTVVGTSMRTTPMPLSLGPMDDAAVAAVARMIAVVDDRFPSVTGPTRVVDAFLAAYASTGSAGAGRPPGSRAPQLLYVIDEVTVPDVEGELVTATLDELGDAERWYDDFAEESHGVRPERNEGNLADIRRTVSSGRLRWWCVDSQKVSMVGHAIPVETPVGVVARVGPVLTPKQFRRRGYAGAATGGVTKLLLDGGARVMLYTDATNPTSNSVYRSLGYEQIDEFVHVTLGEGGGR
jgi:FR47-like protein